MRWFKHMTDASDDRAIVALELEFGLAGYARYFKILEIIGKSMKKGDGTEVALPWPKWESYLVAKRQLLRSYLLASAQLGLINFSESGQLIVISVPKLLKYRDEYARKSGHPSGQAPEKCPPQNTETDTENREQKNPKKKNPSDSQKKSAKELVESFVIEPKHREWAATNAPLLKLDAELEAWRDRLRSADYRYGKGKNPVADAQASFYTHCRVAQSYAAEKAARGGRFTNGALPIFTPAPRKSE